MKDANDKKRLAQSDRIARDQRDWKWLMEHAEGRRIVAGLVAAGQLEEDLFNGNSRDAFIEGKRSLCRYVLHRARDHFDNFLLMQKEQNDERSLAG